MFASTDACVPRNAAIKEQTLVVVWVWSEAALGFALPQRDAEGVPRPRKTRILALSRGNVTVTRLDEFTLRLRPDDGFLPREMDRLSRGPSQPLRPGDGVRLSDMTATVDEVVDGWRPQTVTFRFSAPLESPHFLWMRGDGMRLVGWTPPKVGETVVVPALL